MIFVNRVLARQGFVRKNVACSGSYGGGGYLKHIGRVGPFLYHKDQCCDMFMQFEYVVIESIVLSNICHIIFQPFKPYWKTLLRYQYVN